MKIFLDESGDLGYSENGSNYFIIATIKTHDERRVGKIIKNARSHHLKKSLKQLPEMKFNKTERRLKIRILEKLANSDIEIGYIALKKKKSISTQYFSHVKTYMMLSGILINEIIERPKTGKIEFIIDKSFSKKVQKEYDDHLREVMETVLPKGVIINFHHVRSETELCIQAVDFIAGSIFNKYEHCNESYYEIIESKVSYQTIISR